MSNCFNKVNWNWAETDAPQNLPNPSDWIIDPIFSPDLESCTAVGPNAWFYEADGRTIRPMTANEIDVDTQTISVLKTARLEEVNALRDKKMTSGFTDSNNIVWNTGPADISNLNAVCTLVLAGAITADLTWRDANNINHTIAPSNMIQLAGEMAVFGQTVYGVSWYHKANISALSTISALQVYDITIGW